MTKEELKQRRRKTTRAHMVIILVLLAVTGCFLFRFAYDNGGQVYNVDKFSEEAQRQIVEAYGLSQNMDYGIESMKVMWAAENAFQVLVLKGNDFQSFMNANPHMCRTYHEYGLKSLVFPMKNYRPINDDNYPFTVRYSHDRIYISAYCWEIKEANDIFWELYKK